MHGCKQATLINGIKEPPCGYWTCDTLVKYWYMVCIEGESWFSKFSNNQSFFITMVLRGWPHYKQLNFGGGSDWLGATAAALMGTTHAGDRNNVALKSRVLPHDELPLVFSWEFLNFGILCGVKLTVVWYMTIGKVMRCKHLLWKVVGTIVHISEPQLP